MCVMSISEQVDKWYTVPERAPRAAGANVPNELRDLVRLATAARRVGYPDMIWTSSCSGSHKAPGHGATLVMCTVAGAANLFARLPTSPHQMQQQLQSEIRENMKLPATAIMALGHFHLELKAHLQEQGEHCLKGCFVWPPVGVCAVHPSGCDPIFAGPEGRPADWSVPWVAPDTRREEDRPHPTPSDALGEPTAPGAWTRTLRWFKKGKDKWVCPPRPGQ